MKTDFELWKENAQERAEKLQKEILVWSVRKAHIRSRITKLQRNLLSADAAHIRASRILKDKEEALEKIKAGFKINGCTLQLPEVELP